VAILITGAGVDDGVAAPMLLATLSPDNFPRLVIIFGDRKYHNHHLHAWMAANRPDWRIDVKRRPEGSKGFTPLGETLGGGTDKRLERSLPKKPSRR
jgi:putative transposase